MTNNTRICKICGTEYPYCKTDRRGVARWQDVACCPEHAAEYFRKVEVARGVATHKVESVIISAVAEVNATDENMSQQIKPEKTSKGRSSKKKSKAVANSGDECEGNKTDN